MLLFLFTLAANILRIAIGARVGLTLTAYKSIGKVSAGGLLLEKMDINSWRSPRAVKGG